MISPSARYRRLGDGQEFVDPRDAADAALALRAQWAHDIGKKVALSFGDADIGWSKSTRKDVLAWAEKAFERADKCAECGKPLGKERWRPTEWAEDDEFCSEYCADKAYSAFMREQESEFEPNARLRSTENTHAVEKLVRRAAVARFGRGRYNTPFYEHGQWRLEAIVPGADDHVHFAVVDAYPGVAGTGLDFEEL
jgi:hypothetical protein